MPSPIIINYETQVTNKPKINNSVISGNKSLDDYGIQSKLNISQMNAVNSNMTALDKQKYDNYENTKQNKLDDEQLEVLQSGINATLLLNILSLEFLKSFPGYVPNIKQHLVSINGIFQWENVGE